MNKLVIIYGLVDPRNNVMRYVGRTRAALKTRLASHKADTALDWTGKARGYSLDKVKWMVELREAGLSPTIRVLEEVPADQAMESERRWVQSLFKAGVPLTNRQWRPPSCYDSPEWLRGYATALIDLHRHCGQRTTVRSVLEVSGIQIEKFRKAGVEELDLKELAKCYAKRSREEPIEDYDRRSPAVRRSQDRARVVAQEPKRRAYRRKAAPPARGRGNSTDSHESRVC